MKSNAKGLVRTLIAPFIAALLVPFGACQGSDWPHYRGPNHNGVSSDRIITNWPAEGPRQLWKVRLDPVTEMLRGYGSFAVSGERAYTLINRTIAEKDQEVCVAFQADTGAELWVSSALSLVPGSWPATSTPALDSNRVYVLSSDLKLFCLDAKTGQMIWQKDLVSELNAARNSFGNAVSPIVEGNLVIVNATAKGKDRFLAFQKTDGKLIWAVNNDCSSSFGISPAYDFATPVPATIAGVRQIIFFTHSGLTSVAPDSGNILWSFLSNDSHSEHAATPVVADDVVVFGSRLGQLKAIRISKPSDKFVVNAIWSQAADLRFGYSSPVCHDGYVYGLFESDNLHCIELTTGKIMWSHRVASTIMDTGGLLIVDGRILLLTFDGTLVLIQCNPEVYTELARAKVLRLFCFNHPAVCDGRVYAHSMSEAVCLDLAEKVPVPLKLALPPRQPKDHFELLLGDALGNGLAVRRIPQIELLATTNLNLPVTNWVKLTNAVAQTNGILQLEDSNSTRLPQRFFLGIERP